MDPSSGLDSSMQHPVREQQHVMSATDRVNQDMLQHNIQQQDNIAYNPRPYQDQQVMSPNRPSTEDAPMVNPLNGPQSEQRRNWENPVLGIQAEQKTQRAQWEELSQMYNQVRNQYHGLLKDLGRQQDKIDRLPIETMEEKYRKLESRLGEIQRLGTQPIRDKLTSSGLHSIQSTPIQSDSTHSNPMHSDWTQSNPAASNPNDCHSIELQSNSWH